ncbi:VOC family protein [Actinomadura rugatobispora]|uniref:VOC family protein n=1 Tax=Actinomadura rugatobispora TaxID=1994 RepID=A0ABW0ZU55_9ACTN|nr:VOC family protein [Actinomadura rugatobispora]
MPGTTSYEPGWVELASPDPAESRAFYRGLFGWGSHPLTDERVSGYEMFTLGGDADGPEVAGMDALTDDSLTPTWTCYFKVADMGKAAAAVREAGGLVLLDGVDAGSLGRMALATDPEGAGFGLWRPSRFPGAAVAGEPGTMSCVLLVSRDADAAGRFYGRVFGWTDPARVRGASGEVCFEWTSTGRPIASVVCAAGEAEDEPPYWTPCFVVADCDAACAEAERLGGSVARPCAESSHGRHALLTDPTGASLAVVQPPR